MPLIIQINAKKLSGKANSLVRTGHTQVLADGQQQGNNTDLKTAQTRIDISSAHDIKGILKKSHLHPHRMHNKHLIWEDLINHTLATEHNYARQDTQNVGPKGKFEPPLSKPRRYTAPPLHFNCKGYSVQPAPRLVTALT